MSRIRSSLTYANVMATVAVFLALGGGAYAAISLPKNSVGTKQIKKNAVTSKKVKNGSLLSQDFKAGQLRQGGQGAPGLQGAKGDKGDTGAPGATKVTTRTGTPVAISANTAGGASVSCNPGERAVGGGDSSDRTDGWLVMSEPTGTPPTGWFVVFRSPAATTNLTAYVVCAAP